MNVPQRTVDLFIERGLGRDFSACWEWRGARSWTGYGNVPFTTPGKKSAKPAHRVSYMLFKGPIPAGLEIDHLCRNRGCVNPCHLEAVTHAENMRRAIPARGADNHNGAKTHCSKGHPFAGDNLRIDPKSGRRVCRTCNREGVRAFLARQAKASAA